LAATGKMASNYKTDNINLYLQENNKEDINRVSTIIKSIKSDVKAQRMFLTYLKFCHIIIINYRDVIKQNEKLIGMIEEELKK
jgi:hypothetical protein